MKLVSTLKSFLGAGQSASSLQTVPSPLVTAPARAVPGVQPGTPVYPAPLPYVRAAAVDELMASQREVIRELKMQLRLKEDEFEIWIVPVLERYAAFVHLLPASAEHHHSQPGGMWAHSLEVARESARLANSIELVDVEVDPVERHALLPRWRMAAGVAGLLHDIGKPIADVGAVSAAGEVWNAFEMPLASWIEERAQSGYHFHWRRGKRGKMHEMFGLLGVREVLGGAFLAHLTAISGGFDVLLDMFGAIVGIESPSNRLVDIVKQADSRSVAADLERSMRGHAAVGEGGRYSLGARLMHGVKELVAAKRWPINRPGSAVWVTDKGVFLVFPEILRVVREHLVDAGIAGIPADPIVLADTLAAQGVISVWTSENGVARKTSRVKIALPEEAHFADLTFTVLRLENPAAHLDGILNVAPLGAIVLEGADSPTVPLGPIPAPPAAIPPAPATSESTVNANPAAPAPTAAAAATPNAVEARAPVLRDSNEATEPRNALTSRVDPGTRKAIDDATAAMARAGAAGELLMWICEDLGTGLKKWKTDASDDGTHVALRIATALAGYGSSPTDAAQTLIKAEWIEHDPKSPTKRAQPRMFGTEEDAALVLKLEPSRWVRAIASAGSSQATHVAAQPAPKATRPATTEVTRHQVEQQRPAPPIAAATAPPTPVVAQLDAHPASATPTPAAQPGTRIESALVVAPTPPPVEPPAPPASGVSEVEQRNSAIAREMYARLLTAIEAERLQDCTSTELKHLTQIYADELALSVDALAAILRSGNNPLYVRTDGSTRINPKYRPEPAP